MQSGFSWLKLLCSASTCSHKEKENSTPVRASKRLGENESKMEKMRALCQEKACQLRTSQVQAALRLDSSAGREADTGKATASYTSNSSVH